MHFEFSEDRSILYDGPGMTIQLEGFRSCLCGKLTDYKTNDIVVWRFTGFTTIASLQPSPLVFTKICEDRTKNLRLMERY